MGNTDPTTSSWHLDKRIPLTLIFAMVVQTVWIANALTTRGIQIDDHEKRLDRSELILQRFDDAINDWSRRAGQRQVTLDEHTAKIAKLETTDALIVNNISTILSQLSRIDERTSQLNNAIIDMRTESRRSGQFQQNNRNLSPAPSSP